MSVGMMATGPLRLPLEKPESFVEEFNRTYAKIGLVANVVPATDLEAEKLHIRKLVMTNKVGCEILRQKKCLPCEGGVPVIQGAEAETYLLATPLWSIDESGKMISRKFTVRNFVNAMALMQKVADLAEAEQHHPDLHLTGYRHVRIDLTTHAINGLSENDFIIAAKIDALID